MKIKNTRNTNPQINRDFSLTGEQLAKEMIIFADKNKAAVSNQEFQSKLNAIERLSRKDLINFIRKFDREESVIELICDEIGDDKKTRREACEKILNALVKHAQPLGIDTKDFEQQFKDELDNQFGKDIDTGFDFLNTIANTVTNKLDSKYINTEKLDKIINALTQSIENRQNFTTEDIRTIRNTSVEVGQEQSNGIIENRLEKAYSAFGERVGEDGEMTTKDKDGNLYNGQMQRDGIAADIADGFSKIWNNKLFYEDGNTADFVRRDLKIANKQLRELKEAKLQGEDAYKAKFKEIFGVEYDYANIVAYQKAEATYINASASHEFEMGFNRSFKALLSGAPLREEVQTVYTGEIYTNQIMANKKQVFEREFENLAKFLTQEDTNGNKIEGKEILNKAFEEKGVADGTIEEKFEVLKQITQALSKQLHSATLEAGGGKEFSEIQAMYDHSYKAAYGVENDTLKRVTDYNVSQELGAGAVKAGATITASIIAGLSGCGLVGVAAWTAAATVGAEVIDRGSSGKALNTLREEGLGEYLETTFKDVDWEATLKQAAMSGGAVLIGGAFAKGVTFLMEGQTPIAQAIAMFGADVITDIGLEYVTTGKVTVEGVVYTVALALVGNTVQLLAMKRADVATTEAKAVATDADINTDFAAKLADIKGSDGKPLLSKSDITKLLKNSTDLSGKPISNFEAKVLAVLNNPKEIAILANSKNRAGYIYRAIQDPFGSTIELNPSAFGVKPKTTDIVKTTTGATSNTPDFKTRLMTAESPTDFNPASLQQWADDMGLHLTIEEGSSRTAIFRDDSEHIIRRITEDYRSKGTVYDDRISYYENGRHTAGRLKYNFEPFAKTYEVSLDGKAINLQHVKLETPQAATTKADINTNFATKVADEAIEGTRAKTIQSQVEELDITGKTIDTENSFPESKVSTADNTTAVQAETLAKSTGTTENLPFWSRLKNKILGVETLDDVLAKARKNGAEVTEISPGVYEVKQKSGMFHGEVRNLEYSKSEGYNRITTTTYKDGSTTPTSIRREFFDMYGYKKTQTATTQFNIDGIVQVYEDAGSGYRIEYRGYDASGNKISQNSPSVKIFNESNNLIREFSGQEIENALLVTPWSSSDPFTQSLLNVKTVLNDYEPGKIISWQADQTNYFINNGRQYDPLNFIKEVKPEELQPYKPYTTETPAFKQKIQDYNSYAQARNLTIEEVPINGNPVLQFKNAEGQIVRSVDASSGVETFNQYTRNIVKQSAVLDAEGNIINRTMNNIPRYSNEPTSSIELDFVNNRSILTDLRDKTERTLENGFELFRNFSRNN